MIICQGYSIGVKQYMATNYEDGVVRTAIQNYAHLVRGSGAFLSIKRLSFGELASMIGNHYSLANPRNAEVVRVLQCVHARNTSTTRTSTP